MRLLVITNDYPPKVGGIERYLEHVVAGFPGPTCVVAPRDDRAIPSAGVLRGPWRFMWPTPAVVRWIEQAAVAFAPDVVLFGSPFPLAFTGPRLRKTLGVPFAILAHGADVTVPAGVPGLRRVVAGLFRDADVVCTTSGFTTRAVARLVGRTPHALGAGVDLETFRPATSRPPRSRLVIGTIGRFVPRKGQRDVLTAVAALRADGADVEVLIVGYGRLEGVLRRHAAALAVPARFVVDRTWERVPELYREMDVFALPCRSRWLGREAEGFGLVFLEAAASGLPVVVGDSGGAAETTEHEVSGFVVRDRRQLLAALTSLVADPARAAAMGARGRSRMERDFSWEAVVQRLLPALESAVTSFRSGS